jgi:peroxiredoxin Q/BCP
MKLFLVLVMCVLATSLLSQAAGGELKAGDPAPDFQLKGSDGKTYKLSDLKGKQAVVIAWFPKAFTGG